MPMRNHWWNATLYPSARGLTTRRMPVEAHNLEIEIDLVDHRLAARTTDSDAGFALHDGLSVAEFLGRFHDTLDLLEVRADIKAEPFGVPMTTPFARDREHTSYDAEAVTRFLRVLQWSADVLEEFAGWYCGKSSPVHLFWHSFDLATSRFSGRRAAVVPERRGRSRGVLARGHQLRLLGRRPDQPVPRVLLVHGAGADRASRGRRCAPRAPSGSRAGAARSRSSATRTSGARADPKATLLSFLQSAYEAGASLAGWDLADTATPWCPIPGDRLTVR